MICPGILRDSSLDESLYDGHSNSLDKEGNGATMVGESEGIFCSAINWYIEETKNGISVDSGNSLLRRMVATVHAVNIQNETH